MNITRILQDFQI